MRLYPGQIAVCRGVSTTEWEVGFYPITDEQGKVGIRTAPNGALIHDLQIPNGGQIGGTTYSLSRLLIDNTVTLQANTTVQVLGTSVVIIGNCPVEYNQCLRDRDAINTPTLTADAVTVDLDNANHFYVDLSTATGTVTLTLQTGDAGTTQAGQIVIKQDTPARDITWAAGTNITTGRWQTPEPNWSGMTSATTAIVSYLFDGTDIFLTVTGEEDSTF